MKERILRLNELIKREFSLIVLKEVDFPEGVFVTITRVDTSDDLKQANVYISVMPENKSKLAIDIIKKQMYFLQQKLNKRLRMRPIPRINFTSEKLTFQAAKIEEILEKLKKEEE